MKPEPTKPMRRGGGASLACAMPLDPLANHRPSATLAPAAGEVKHASSGAFETPANGLSWEVNMTVQVRLFLMMVLQLAVWGACAPKLFPYMGMLGFQPWQQSLVGSAWGVAAVLGIFFS